MIYDEMWETNEQCNGCLWKQEKRYQKCCACKRCTILIDRYYSAEEYEQKWNEEKENKNDK